MHSHDAPIERTSDCTCQVVVGVCLVLLVAAHTASDVGNVFLFPLDLFARGLASVLLSCPGVFLASMDSTTRPSQSWLVNTPLPPASSTSSAPSSLALTPPPPNGLGQTPLEAPIGIPVVSPGGSRSLGPTPLHMMEVLAGRRQASRASHGQCWTMAWIWKSTREAARAEMDLMSGPCAVSTRR